MYYKIASVLTPCTPEEALRGPEQYAAVVTTEEWNARKDLFDMVIDMDAETKDRRETKAIVNADSLTGSFSVPDRKEISGPRHTFLFALDGKGIVLIDDEDYAQSLMEAVGQNKKWPLPGLERLIFDLLEEIISPDLLLLEDLEHRLNAAEQRILEEKTEELPPELNDIRGDLLDLRVHYEQLIDLGQELQENENGFFKPENLRYFKLFTDRVARLQDTVTSLRDYVVQLRDLVINQLSVRQNRIMTLLTVITSIFLPLTLIAGWYGMNFRYMPELDKPWAYPAVIGVSVLIVIVCLVWFKKKKWL